MNTSAYRTIAAATRFAFDSRIVMREDALTSLNLWNRIVAYLGSSLERKNENRSTHENFRTALKNSHGEEIANHALQGLNRKFDKGKGLRDRDVKRVLKIADSLKSKELAAVKDLIGQENLGNSSYFQQEFDKLQNMQGMDDLIREHDLSNTEAVSIHRCVNEFSALTGFSDDETMQENSTNYMCQERMNDALTTQGNYGVEKCCHEAIAGLEKLPSCNTPFMHLFSGDTSLDYREQVGAKSTLNQFNTIQGKKAYSPEIARNNVIFAYYPKGNACKDVSCFVGDGQAHFMFHPEATVLVTAVLKNKDGGVLVNIDVSLPGNN